MALKCLDFFHVPRMWERTYRLTEFLIRGKVNSKCKTYTSLLFLAKIYQNATQNAQWIWFPRHRSVHKFYIHSQAHITHWTNSPRWSDMRISRNKRPWTDAYTHARTGVSVLNGCYEITARPKRIHARYDHDHHNNNNNNNNNRQRRQQHSTRFYLQKVSKKAYLELNFFFFFSFSCSSFFFFFFFFFFLSSRCFLFAFFIFLHFEQFTRIFILADVSLSLSRSTSISAMPLPTLSPLLAAVMTPNLHTIVCFWLTSAAAKTAVNVQQSGYNHWQYLKPHIDEQVVTFLLRQ